jgi:hypothetical protein
MNPGETSGSGFLGLLLLGSAAPFHLLQEPGMHLEDS